MQCPHRPSHQNLNRSYNETQQRHPEGKKTKQQQTNKQTKIIRTTKEAQ